MEGKELQDKINGTLWAACDTLRGSVPSENYKEYILTMLFVKFVSDTYKEKKEELINKYNGDEKRVKRALEWENFKLEDTCTFDYLYENRNKDDIGDIINKVLEKITQLNGRKLANLFSIVDYNSEKVLGQKKERNAILKTLLEDFNNPILDLRPSKIGNQDVIGNSYEYLIAKFASDAGKKGGEYYTPPEVSILLAKLVKPKKNERIYDPTCGSGSLLLKAYKEANTKTVSIYGQEMNGSTYSLCIMNMFLHDVNDAHIEWGDTISNPKHKENDELMKFDVIVSNPPFSLDKWAKGFEAGNNNVLVDGKKQNEFKFEASMDEHKRFEYGVPPKSTGDYAFILHMLKSLADEGRMAVVLPHGVLFRGGAEGKIRERILKENLIDAVIGLPENLFYGVTIPAAVVVFKKNRERKDVLFIEASREFEKGKNQNKLAKENIEKIVKIYENYEEVERYSHISTYKEIKENEFNLNIKRYVDTFEEEEEINIEETKSNIRAIEFEIKELENDLEKSLKELGL